MMMRPTLWAKENQPSVYRTKNIKRDGNNIVMIPVLTKSEYDEILKEKRKEFVHKYFEAEIKTVFEELRKKAEKGQKCLYTASFTLEDHFDQIVTQEKIAEYFTDLGYCVTPTPTSNQRTISIVLG